jgi:hypothetical protein
MSTKVIDVYNTLNLISDYNTNGLTGTSNRITIDSSGFMSIWNSKQSQNSSTGALVLTGGGLSINAFTNATSVSNGGALTVAGGVAIAQDLIVGGSIYYSNAAQASSTFAYLTLTASDQSTDIGNGALVVMGGISIQTSGQATSITSGGGLTIAGGAAVGSDFYVGGTTHLLNTIATNLSLGSLVATNNLSTNSTLTNALVTNATITNAIITNGLNATFNSNTLGSAIFTTGGNVGINTTSPTYKLDLNGSFRTRGTAGTLNLIAGSTTTDILQLQNTNASGASSIQLLNTAGTATAYFGYANSNATQLQNNVYLLSNSGIPVKIIAGNQTSTPVIFNAVDNSMSITTTTASTDTSSGALKVSGGVAIQGNLNVGGQLNINSPFTVNISSTQASSNSTTGAMKLVGGLSINLTDTTNSNATSYTAGGSLTMSGGMAVAQDTYIGGILDIKSGSNNMNPLKLQSIQISSNYNNGASTVIQSGDASRTASSFTPISFAGWNDQANPKLTINAANITVPSGVGLIALNNSNTIGSSLFTTAGNVGIGTTSPNAPLQFSNALVNRKLVLYDTNNNNHQFYGIGTTSGIFRFQVDTTGVDYVFYAGVNSTTSNEVFRVKGVGNVVIPNTTNSAVISTGSLWVTNENITNSTITTLNVTGITAGNINFTGALYQNGNLYISSQWTGTTGNSLFYGSSGNVSVGIGTTNPTYTLDVAGKVRINNTQDSINSTTGALYTVGGISIATTTDASSFTQGGALTVAGGASIAKTLCVGNYLNLAGTSSLFGGSFTGGNNVVTPTDVTGLLFPNVNVRSFTAIIGVSILCTSGGNYFAQYTIEGIQNDSGWSIDDTYIGDNTGISFSITSSGQIQYTSTNIVNWLSTTLRFNGNLISISGNYLPGVLSSTGNFNVTGALSVYSSTDSTNTSNGALQVTGGAGITKNLSVGGNLIMNGSSYMFGGAFSANNGTTVNGNVTGLLFPSANYRSFSVIMGISVSATTPLYSQYTIEGIQRSSGWYIYVTTLGDTVDFTFGINSSGQLTYSSSTTYSGWSSTIFNYQATAISITTGNVPVTLPTSGNQTITGTLAITATQNTTATSTGALTVTGGAGIGGDLRIAGNIYSVPQFAVFEEQQANGVSPSTYSAGTYATRVLNTSVNNTITGSSLSSNQFTLPAGTYKIQAYCPNYGGGYSKAVLYNVTASSNTLYGTNSYANGASSNVSLSYSIISNIFTIASTSTFAIQQYFSVNNSQMGGVPASSGQIETYTHVEITKLL